MTVSQQNKEYANITGYEPTGKIGTIAHANGTETVYSYDAPSTRLTNIVSKDAAQVVIQDRGYFYTKAGDIDLIADSLKGITYTYTYDDLHRLKTETNTGTYDALSYTYDAVGNITLKTVGTDTYEYLYQSTAHKHAVSRIKVNGVNRWFFYDANGNMTYGPDLSSPVTATRTITYNADNMPVSINHSVNGLTDIAYDGSGARAKKTVGAATDYYIGDHFEVIGGTATNQPAAGRIHFCRQLKNCHGNTHRNKLFS